jgi:thymidylate synthase
VSHILPVKISNWDAFDTGSEAYPAIVQHIITSGSEVSPRSLPCKELCDVTIRIVNASQAVPVSSRRILNRRIGATEYMQLLAGVSWLEQLDLASNGRFAQFANDQRLRGAYGPRVFNQLPWIAECLTADPSSRQAVVTISKGGRADASEGQRDVPCTIAMQFKIRDSKLNTLVMMRSSDAFLGVPYDWWMFSRLQMTMAWALDVEPGSFTFFAGSLHLYERDIPAAQGLEYIKQERDQPPHLICEWDNLNGKPSRRVMDVQDLAQRLVLNSGADSFRDPSAEWYTQNLPHPPGVHYLCEVCRYIVPAEETCQHVLVR